MTCSHNNRDKYDGALVCNDCGVVLEEENIFYVDEAGDHTEYGNSKQYFNDIKQNWRFTRLVILLKLTSDMCDKFGLSEVIAKQSKHILTLMEGDMKIEKSHGCKAVCAVIYLVSRTNNSMSQVTLTELATSLGQDTTRLLYYISVAKPYVLKADSTLPSHSPIPFLEPFIHHVGVQGDDRKTLLRLSIELAEFAERCSLVEGRKESFIAAACIIIAAQTQSLSIDVTEYAAQIGLRERTIVLRMGEIQKALLEDSKNTPHYNSSADSLTKSNIAHFIPEILRNNEMRRMASRPPLPLAFLNSVHKENERRKQIKEAKRRLSSRKISRKDLKLDDLIIERLLLHNVPEDRIAAANNSSRLISLEEEFCIYLD